MRYDPNKHHRRSIRLKGYDYSRAGAYFVTICMYQRECLFGAVVDGVIRANEAGLMVGRWWLELARKFPALQTDTYVIMPNHVHGIIVISDPDTDDPVGADLRVCPNGGRNQQGEHADQRGEHADQQGEHAGSPLPTADGAMVQNHDDQRIYAWCENIGLDVVFREIVATQLFRTYHPR